MTADESSKPDGGSVAAGSAGIGVFDSGVGGLTVAAALRAALPDWPIVYLGDTARLPYGTKSQVTVQRYTEHNVSFLRERGVSLVVVACNSASALALEPGQGRIESDGESIEVVGVIEPGAAQAAAIAERRVGVVATAATVDSGAYPRAIAALRPELEVVATACPLLVPLVEEGWLDDPVTHEVVRRYLAPLIAEDIDTLILGCTHYPVLRAVFAEALGPGVRLVDSAEATGRVVAERLRDRVPPRGDRELQVFVTDASPRFAQIARRILGEDVELEWVDRTPGAGRG